MTPARSWTSADGTAYPVAWRITIPAVDLTLEVAAAIDDQELNLAVRYWEGMVKATGTRAARRVTGRGYLELTGYDNSADPRTRR
jgi:predicted secreted hydrolase